MRFGLLCTLVLAACEGEHAGPAAQESPPPVSAADTAAARPVVVRYLSHLKEGRANEAAGLWCNAGDAARFAKRLATLPAYVTNPADGRSDREGGIAVSLQWLGRDDLRNIFDGEARLESRPGREPCIAEIAMQPPPAPL